MQSTKASPVPRSKLLAVPSASPSIDAFVFQMSVSMNPDIFRALQGSLGSRWIVPLKSYM